MGYVSVISVGQRWVTVIREIARRDAGTGLLWWYRRLTVSVPRSVQCTHTQSGARYHSDRIEMLQKWPERMLEKMSATAFGFICHVLKSNPGKWD